MAVGGRNSEIFGPYGRWGGRKIGYSQPIRFRLSPLFRRHDDQRIGGSPHFSKRTKTRSPVHRGIVADAGAPRQGRPERGLIRCGSLSIARSRQNGLGSIPLSCVTRSVDRLTDEGHVEDLMPGRGRASLSLAEGWRSYGPSISRRGKGRCRRQGDFVDGARVRNFRLA